MTTLQEAARKALYALEASIDGDHPYYEDQLTAIESLRTALAQQKLPQKERPDFMAGYDAGMADANRMAQQGEQAKPAAYITDTWQGPMVWTPEMYNDACTYCDDGEFPVPLYTVAPRPTSGDYALGYAEGFNDACKPAPQTQQPVAWYEYNQDLDAWFLAYGHNPKAKTRPLVFGDTAAPAPQAQPITDPCKTCSHFKEGNLPGVRIHDETCYECRSYWGNKWEAA